MTEWPPWAVMWTLSIGIYSGCKLLTWQRSPLAAAPRWKHAAYFLAWPGMAATSFFEEAAATTSRCCGAEWLTAAGAGTPRSEI